MNTVRALLPALGAGFAFTLGGPGEKLAFQPSAGSSVTKTFTIGGEYSLDDLSVIVSGQDLGGMIGAVEVNLEQETKIEISDTYKAVADGRPTELLRTFDRLTAKVNMTVSPAAEIPEMDSTSPLEGLTVAYRWNAEKGEYERSFAGDDGDAALLEGLVEDMDLRVFLPDGEVAADASWTVSLVDLQTVFMPGGDLSMQPAGMDVDPEAVQMFEEMFGDLGDKLGDLLEGECTCTFKGARDENGTRVGEIAIHLEVATTLDLAELFDKAIRTALEQSGAGDMVAVSMDSADLSVDFEGEGTLLWDLKAGRVYSFLLGGDATVGIDLAVGVEAEGESQSVDASLELSGSLRYEVVTAE